MFTYYSQNYAGIIGAGLLAAVVAVSILKLWPAYLEASTPDAVMASLIALTNLSRIKN